jgi:coenzyme PQQ synthesis protein D (PqqD)
MNDQTVITRNPDVVARELPESDGAVLLNVATGAYHGLNPTGLVAWELIDGSRSVGELVDGVRERFPGAPDTLRADVLRFVEGALERDLVRAPQEAEADERG